jgi:acetolactate synthase-1/2/3 large subunit
MNKETTGAEWLARTIFESKITHVFWVDSILRNTLIELGVLGVTRVLTHSEAAAAYMADGYARISGLPGICLAQSVGAANLSAGLQDAYLAHSPVIAVTGRKLPSHQHRNAYQEIAHSPSFSQVTKFSAEVDSADSLPRVFRQAWKSATTGTPGPSHIDLYGLSGEFVESSIVSETDNCETSTKLTIPTSRLIPQEHELEHAASMLLNANRIVIVAGTGATLSNCGSELLEIGKRLSAPIGTSLGGRGLINTQHKLSIGTVGTYSAPPANEIVSRADLVFFIGCGTGDQPTNTWLVPPIDTPVVQIDINPLELGRTYPNTVGLIGDPKRTLQQLISLLVKPISDNTFSQWAFDLVKNWRTDQASLDTSSNIPICPDRLCAEISNLLPEDGILVSDTGYSGIWTSTLIDLNGTSQTYLRAAGSLGWSLPASMGAKCAAPNRKVICFCGDGAMYYHLSELETARRRNLDVVIVINNNSGFGQGWPKLQDMQGTRPGDPAEMLRFGPTNFCEIARSFGVQGIRVTRPEDIAPALKRALLLNEPVVVDVVTDIDSRAPVPWTP